MRHKFVIIQYSCRTSSDGAFDELCLKVITTVNQTFVVTGLD